MKADRSNWPLVMLIYQPGYHDYMTELLGDMLEQYRIRVISAGSEQEVLSVISSHHLNFFVVAGCGSGEIDCATAHVIQDVNGPPRFDGLGLGKLVKQKLPQLQGIFTSGYGFSEIFLTHIDGHGMAFLPKPFMMEELVELVFLLLWQNGERATQADHFFSCGLMKRATRDLPGALRDLNKAIEQNPQDAEAFNHRSEVKSALGDYLGAVADCSGAINILPNYTIAFCNRGIARKAAADMQGALADFNKTIELNPEFGRAYQHRSSIRRLQHDLVGALNDLNQAEASKCFYPDSGFYEERGDVKQALGDSDEAIADYTKAIKIKSKVARG